MPLRLLVILLLAACTKRGSVNPVDNIRRMSFALALIVLHSGVHCLDTDRDSDVIGVRSLAPYRPIAPPLLPKIGTAIPRAPGATLKPDSGAPVTSGAVSAPAAGHELNAKV